MRFRGTLVRSLAVQGDRDGTFIDPSGVVLPTGPLPVLVEFDDRAPVGTATVTLDHGELVAEGWLDGDPEAILGAGPPCIAAGIAVRGDDILDGIRGRVVSSCRLNAVGLTARHADPGQPPIEEVR